MGNFASIAKHQNELIRKALTGSVFVAPPATTAITSLTQTTGTAPNKVIDLITLPAAWKDLGFTTDAGMQFSTETSQSDVSSFQSVSPTRSDIVSRVTTLNVVAQETNILTLGLYTGAELSSIEADPSTGEVSIAIPERPSSQYYRLLSISVDDTGEDGEIYIGRFLPYAKVVGLGGQNQGKGDDPITWDLTFQGFKDSTLGYSERYIFGGPGWKALLTKMGIPDAP